MLRINKSKSGQGRGRNKPFAGRSGVLSRKSKKQAIQFGSKSGVKPGGGSRKNGSAKRL